ncbi:MAG: cytochrome C [Sphingobacteriia bacterium 24-36-13]|nr:MAG: cytochrome C [Sphingobacteriia bacterium 24-36-13]OZA66304.1 MAG: cytochrome C [Sphingobacteriia bacterium 39-36-14]RWZ89458.1 MAG: cytochrome C [Hydrotalea sp. AMD]
MTTMSRIKIGLLVLSVIIIAIQFVQPARNQNRQVLDADITRLYMVPENVEAVLKTSCYDCHSNNTNYPWYVNVQPGGWWLASHIKKGKAELNFDEFGNYSKRRRQSKLKSIASSIEDGTMPLPSYTLIHKNAKLSKEDKTLLLNWVKKTRDSLLLKN